MQLLHSHFPLLRSALQTASIVSLPRAPRFFLLVHGGAPPLDTPFVDTRRRGKRTCTMSKHGDMKAKPCGWTLNLGTARLTITWRLPRGGDGCSRPCALGETTDTGIKMMWTQAHHTEPHTTSVMCVCVYVCVCTYVRVDVSMDLRAQVYVYVRLYV